MATSPKDAAALIPRSYTPGKGRPPLGQEKVNLTEAIKLRIRKHWTFKEIADKYGVSESYICRELNDLSALIPNPEVRSAYAEAKAEILESVQFKMISSLVEPAKIQKATLGNMAYAASKLDEMIRLERGQSTKNINVLSAIIDGTHLKLFGSKQTEQAAPQADANIREITPASPESIEKS